VPLSEALTVNHLSVNYRDVHALRHVSFRVPKGQLVGIFGPNGAGKSTLIKAMLGLTPIVTGMAQYDGQPLMEQRDRTAYVPQRSQIDWTFPATVWDVVLMGRTQKAGWFRRISNVSRRIAQESLERVGMAEFRDRRIGALSGGQQQRVFLARALTQQAEVFFFDEPFVGVDQKTEDILFSIFRELAAEGKTIMVVNHDLGESITHFDTLLLLNRELVAFGPREQVLTTPNMTRAYGGHVQFFAQHAA
jgi:manganese/iron transport system ATP-binding protein